jgi:hypothetical protein
MANRRSLVTYSLEQEYQELFTRIADLTRRTKTDELRIMLDARAIALGLEPVRYVDPKSSASAPLRKAQAPEKQLLPQ